jgi:hypothetical protein|tara:strand:- start:527 stop:2068 length:1542 start_codon:yes stop_codon:yes gene_type:complete
MASYETEFLQALNMASQSATGLLKSIREPDYETKLALETQKRKELMALEQDYAMERLDTTGEQKIEELGITTGSAEDIAGMKIASDQTITDKNIQADKENLATSIAGNLDLANKNNQAMFERLELTTDTQKDMQLIQIGANKESQESSQAFEKMMQDDRQEFKFGFQEKENNFTLSRDLTLHGYALKQMEKGHSYDIDLSNNNHTNKIAQMREQKVISQDMQIFMTTELPKYQRQNAEEQQKWLGEKIKWYKNGNGTGAFEMKTRAEVYMLAQNKLGQAQAEDNFNWQKGKGFDNFIASGTNGFITMSGTGMQMKQDIQNQKYQQRAFDFNSNLADQQFNINLGQRLTTDAMFNNVSDGTKNSIMTAVNGQSGLYGNLNLDNPANHKAVHEYQSFQAESAIGALNLRMDDFNMPDQPSTLFRGKKAHKQYLTQGTNTYNDLSANLLKRSEMLAGIGLDNASKTYKKELKQDLLKGIKLGDRLISSSTKVGGEEGLITGLKERREILQAYYDQL